MLGFILFFGLDMGLIDEYALFLSQKGWAWWDRQVHPGGWFLLSASILYV